MDDLKHTLIGNGVAVVVLVVLVLLFLLVREVWCWYWKINERAGELRMIRQLLQRAETRAQETPPGQQSGPTGF
jgi:hypothetical protein